MDTDRPAIKCSVYFSMTRTIAKFYVSVQFSFLASTCLHRRGPRDNVARCHHNYMSWADTSPKLRAQFIREYSLIYSQNWIENFCPFLLLRVFLFSLLLPNVCPIGTPSALKRWLMGNSRWFPFGYILLSRAPVCQWTKTAFASMRRM